MLQYSVGVCIPLISTRFTAVNVINLTILCISDSPTLSRFLTRSGVSLPEVSNDNARSAIDLEDRMCTDVVRLVRATMRS